jgi:hypothetical protein
VQAPLPHQLGPQQQLRLHRARISVGQVPNLRLEMAPPATAIQHARRQALVARIMNEFVSKRQTKQCQEQQRGQIPQRPPSTRRSVCLLIPQKLAMGASSSISNMVS